MPLASQADAKRSLKLWSWRKQQVHGILFDVDGTLYRQGPVRRAMLGRLLRAHLTSPRRGWQTLQLLRAYRNAQENMRGNADVPVDLAAAQLHAACGGRVPDGATALIERWMELEALDLLPRARYDGLLPFCDAARAAGVRLGAFSDYPPQRKIDSLGLTQYFDTVVSAQDPQVCRFKPDPTGLEVSAARMRLRPEQVIYIGDRSDVDAPAAAAAGMQCFIVGTAKPAAPQTWTDFSDYAQLRSLLEDNSH